MATSKGKTYQESLRDFLGISFFKRSITNNGYHFFIVLLCAYIGCKGTLSSLTTRVALPYFKELRVEGVSYQTAVAVSSTPWAMKGLIGALSDSLPLLGYNKAPYIVIASALGFAGSICLSLLSRSFGMANPAIPPVLLLAITLQIATVDLLCEGKYSEIMRKNLKIGSDTVTLVWLCIMMGSLIAAILVGPIVDAFGTAPIFFMCIPLSGQILLPILLGWLPEERAPVESRNRLDMKKLKKEKMMFLISALMTAGAVGQAIFGLFFTQQQSFIYMICISSFLVMMCVLCMPRTIALCNIYMFCHEMLQPNLAGALDYWYTASQECVPGGPSFSYTYYSTWTGLVGMFASFSALIIFQRFMSKMSFRKAFWVTAAIRSAASIVDIIIINRWNIWGGVPDKVMYIFGDAIVLDLLRMLSFMPGVVLIARLCPQKMESTVYAILAGFTNFGQNVARFFGGFGIEIAGIKTIEPCNFNSLPLLILICQTLLPLLTIPLTYILVPDSPMNKPLNVLQMGEKEEETIITEESDTNIETLRDQTNEQAHTNGLDDVGWALLSTEPDDMPLQKPSNSINQATCNSEKPAENAENEPAEDEC